jgi:NADH-quinone oxidoreductase subunit H
MLAGSMDLVTIAEKQAGWLTNWYLFHDPFTFVIFWVYVTCAVASVNRAPFDLAEAESELVAGFHTEYSGLRWSYFFMAEYGSMFLVSALAAVLFMGGWNGPIPVAKLLGLSAGTGDTAGYFVRLLGMANLLGKATLGVLVMMWVRWTLPRLRIDQVMTTCLKYCTPLAAAMFAGVMLWQLALPGGLVRGLTRPAGEIREGWLEGPGGKAAAGGTARVFPFSPRPLGEAGRRPGEGAEDAPRTVGEPALAPLLNGETVTPIAVRDAAEGTAANVAQVTP